jgi:hypothetical protein
MARPTKLTPEIADGIVLAVKTGAPLAVAAQAMGISPATFFDWMAAGEGRPSKVRGGPRYSEFSDRVRRAEAEVHLLTIGTVRTAVVGGNWKAAQAWMRMRWANHYAERTEVSGPDGGAIPLEIAGILGGMTDDDLTALRRRLAAEAGGGGAGAAEEDPDVRLDDPGEG